MVVGNPATIPAKIKSDTPLPRFFSDINSPSHIRNTDPAAITKSELIQVKISSCPITPCRESKTIKPYPCSIARGTVKSRENWLNFCLPASPSYLYICSRDGNIIVKSCMMIEPVMYGPRPSITIEKLSKPPPVKALINPNS